MSCDFCGKARADVDKLIVANEAAICNECIELCANILDTERIDNIKADRKINRVLDPAKVKHYLDQYVIGQSNAKIALAVTVVNHYKRVFFKPKMEVEKSNLLM
jgi:ATP-dependent Clp protease ATP-binding subunit ClpX